MKVSYLLNNNTFRRVGVEPINLALQSHARAPAPQQPRSGGVILDT